ncbi:hypothetical protein [Rubritalea profundi]|uniref:SLA1 homology domain-containing protein n=1 Tax=Rubritalea profundi TaxID=1658618 RepID=A0A2S7TYU2_9BACT|nr:hypothetical protein [Rubritalea profundi]PQJ27153.1 hypothetical protein BSZ32_00650 [Rubritalea profundi]
MFSKSYKIVLALSLLGLPAQARTWTSVDGLKTFEGEYKSFDQETKEVTVLRKYKKLKFSMDVLSPSDRDWVNVKVEEVAAKEAAANAPTVEEQLAAQTVGSKLNEKTLVRLDGKRFKKAQIEKVPEYYLLYYSASW